MAAMFGERRHVHAILRPADWERFKARLRKKGRQLSPYVPHSLILADLDRDKAKKPEPGREPRAPRRDALLFLREQPVPTYDHRYVGCTIPENAVVAHGKLPERHGRQHIRIPAVAGSPPN